MNAFPKPDPELEEENYCDSTAIYSTRLQFEKVNRNLNKMLNKLAHI